MKLEEYFREGHDVIVLEIPHQRHAEAYVVTASEADEFDFSDLNAHQVFATVAEVAEEIIRLKDAGEPSGIHQRLARIAELENLLEGSES